MVFYVNFRMSHALKLGPLPKRFASARCMQACNVNAVHLTLGPKKKYIIVLKTRCGDKCLRIYFKVH